MYEEQGDELMATWALETIGMVTTIAGRHEEAVPIITEAIARFERLGDAFGLRNALAVIARAFMHLGRLDEARVANRRALGLASSMNDVTSVSASLLDAASLFALTGRMERAAVSVGAAQKIMDDSGGQPPPQLVNRIDALPTLQQELAPERLAELMAKGRETPIDEAAALALED